jgi:general L-amino acid transport system substrate-binding protein
VTVISDHEADAGITRRNRILEREETLMRRCNRLALLVPVLAMAALAANAVPAQTLHAVKGRGELVCGVSDGLLGFSSVDDKGVWSGFDVDTCRAVAAAIFNDAGKVQFVALQTEQRFAALQSGKVDLLARNATWTMSREGSLGVLFAAVTYYDGQGFLVRRSRNVESALELDGAKICTLAGTTSELNLGDYFHNNHMRYTVLTFATAAESARAYDEGQCDVLTSDISQLYSTRLSLKTPDDHVIMPEVISKEPLAPVVRQGDDQWFNIVKWSLFAMLDAEELGVSSSTVAAALKSEKPDVRRLVGTEGNFGEQVGLTNDWAARIVSLVGNYGEVFDRNVGAGSKLGIPRGLNGLWTNGGIQYAPPIR